VIYALLTMLQIYNTLQFIDGDAWEKQPPIFGHVLYRPIFLPAQGPLHWSICQGVATYLILEGINVGLALWLLNFYLREHSWKL